MVLLGVWVLLGTYSILTVSGLEVESADFVEQKTALVTSRPAGLTVRFTRQWYEYQ